MNRNERLTFPTPLQDECLKVTTSNTLPAGFLSFCTEMIAVAVFLFLSKIIVSFLTLKLNGLKVSRNELLSS